MPRLLTMPKDNETETLTHDNGDNSKSLIFEDAF